MDFYDHNIHLVREAIFIEEKPGNLKIVSGNNPGYSNISKTKTSNGTMVYKHDQESNYEEIDTNHYPTIIKIKNNFDNNYNNISEDSYTEEIFQQNNNHENSDDGYTEEIFQDENNLSIYENDVIIQNKKLVTENSNKDNNENISNNNNKRPLSPTEDTHISKYRITNTTEEENISENIVNNTIYNIDNNDKNSECNTLFSINTEVPLTFNDIFKREDWKEWRRAIRNELFNLYNNKVMIFTKNIPENTNVISTKWVFNIKRDSNNKISTYKARLVARGYKQKYGIDYDNIYSPTLDIVCIRLILSLAAKFKWNTYQLDIKAAYLNAPLDKNVYVSFPQGDKNYNKGFWLLKKSLYGLKQSGRNWNITISEFLSKIGFTQCKSESCLFYKIFDNSLTCLIGLYVDDMIISGTNQELISTILKIKNKFSISKCETINFILGIQVVQKNFSYTISQKSYIENILSKYNFNNIKKSKTPCTGENYVSKNNSLFDKTIYKSAIGSLIHLAKCTRPDIAYAVNNAARYCENPTVSDWHKIINIFKYLNFSMEYSITYDGSGEFIAYSDADFGGDKNDRKSTSGNLICMGNKPIFWSSKKQKVVALSTAEAELISTSELTRKILWLRNIFKEILNKNITIKIYTDNLSSKKIIENGQFNNNMKHIDLREHFIFDAFKNNKIILEYIKSENMLADTLTKNTNGPKMTKFTNLIFNKQNK